MGVPGVASVVVVGGGVMGCSVLYHLAQLGVTDAVLVERDKLTSGTTWHSAAQVRALRSSYALTELIRYSINLYAQLEKETGQSVGWINKGSLSLACNPARLVHIRRQEMLARVFGLQAFLLSADEARERWPWMNADDVLGAVFAPEDGRVSPSDLCAALIKGAKARGARVFENTAVKAVQTRGGRVCGVRTAAGEIRCEAVAVCAGLWSRGVARSGGADAPLWGCEHFYLLTQPVDGLSGNLPTLSDHDSHLYVRDDSGGLLVGCFEPHGKALSAEKMQKLGAFELLPEDWTHFEPMMQNAMARVPALADAGLKTLLNGAESFTPDGMFLLGETAQTHGLFLGCGMNSVGVATGGGGGYALAHCIVRGYSPIALPEAAPERFPDSYQSAAALAARAPEVLGRHYEISFPAVHFAAARDLRLPPLTALWRQRRAHFGQFYGWERPLYFGKTREPQPTFCRPDWFAQVGDEVMAAHRRAAVFDLSTLGKIAVRGGDAERFLNRVCTANMARDVGRVMHTAVLNARGGVVGEWIVLRISEEHYLLYTGTAAVCRDLTHLRRQVGEKERVQLSDETEQWATLALCGAESSRLAAADWAAMALFAHGESAFAGCAVRVARLSYVGECGWEITCRTADAMRVAQALLDGGAQPAGVLAQSAMRIEKGFVAYGHDADETMTATEAGFAADWNKDFVGREAALRRRDENADDARRVVCVVADDGQPPPDELQPQGDEPVFADDEIIGQTTSAAFGYRLQRTVALATVRTAPLAAAGHNVKINIAGRLLAGRAVFGAAYDATGERVRVGAAAR